MVNKSILQSKPRLQSIIDVTIRIDGYYKLLHMCHLICGARIRSSILKQMCTTQVLTLTFSFPLEHMRTTDCFQILVDKYFSSIGQPTSARRLCCIYSGTGCIPVIKFQTDCNRCALQTQLGLLLFDFG
jgi:hypothetical protein